MPLAYGLLLLCLLIGDAWTNSSPDHSFLRHADTNKTIGLELFNDLEELARIVDISYCVGVTGIWKPFTCISRCHQFPSFELVTVWTA